MRELLRAMFQDKPIITLLESDCSRGAVSRAQVTVCNGCNAGPSLERR